MFIMRFGILYVFVFKSNFLQGWCTSVYGPTAFFVAYAKGVLKSAIADENVIGDLIPVDLVVNGIVTAAMKTACDFTDNPRDVKADLEKGPEISFTEEGNLRFYIQYVGLHVNKTFK